MTRKLLVYLAVFLITFLFTYIGIVSIEHYFFTTIDWINDVSVWDKFVHLYIKNGAPYVHLSLKISAIILMFVMILIKIKKVKLP